MNRMAAESSLNLYITAVHPCPYLTGREAMNLLVDPGYNMTDALYSRLLNSGFRRSGADVYRPHCKHCNACVSTRIPVNEFRANRSQRRNFEKNSDLQVRLNLEGFKPEYAQLYHKYIRCRHAGGGMDTDSTDTFAGFLLTRWCNTALVEFRHGSTLLAVAAMDQLKNGLSSVYTFFSPTEGNERGLGTYAVLWQIVYAQQLGLEYVYPGYWIAESDKMNYKTRFQPIEGLVNGVWTRLEK
ncbi:MAG: arginyltransferase [Gammaproteobacteria bacterium]|nr:arginyltransferase [Gammaproteobacteria bacterium]MBU1722560.1 arginyltransferase [Gammaproteobacteria bacterium]MBU2004461.1 arginyltransferase [Gammaproteobacteria bacterium]